MIPARYRERTTPHRSPSRGDEADRPGPGSHDPSEMRRTVQPIPSESPGTEAPQAPPQLSFHSCPGSRGADADSLEHPRADGGLDQFGPKASGRTRRVFSPHARSRRTARHLCHRRHHRRVQNPFGYRGSRCVCHPVSCTSCIPTRRTMCRGTEDGFSYRSLHRPSSSGAPCWLGRYRLSPIPSRSRLRQLADRFPPCRHR